MSTPLDDLPDSDATPPRRQCGRCRGWFPGDPTLQRSALAEWWACPPCRHSLLIPAGARTGAEAPDSPTATGDAS